MNPALRQIRLPPATSMGKFPMDSAPMSEVPVDHPRTHGRHAAAHHRHPAGGDARDSG